MIPSGRVVAVMLALLAPAAAGADVPRIRISLHRCLQLKEDLVSGMVHVELKGHVTARSGAVTGGVGAEVRCAKGGVVIEIFDDDTATLVATRTVDLTAFGAGARPRLLALTIAEMVDAVWESAAPPAPESLAPAVAEQPVAAASPRADAPVPEVQASAGLDIEPPPPPKKVRDLRLYDFAVRVSTRKFAQGPFEFGGSLRGAIAFDERLVAEGDLSVERGESGTDLGPVSGTTYSLGAWVGLRLDLEPIELRGGVGLRAGVASLAGSPRPEVRAGTVTGGWVGPMVVVVARWLLSDVMVDLGLDGGVNLTPVRGRVAGGEEVSIAGGWLGVQLGVGYRL